MSMNLSKDTDTDVDEEQEDILVLTVEEEDHGLRLDRFLADHCAELSRTRLKNLIKDGMVTVQDKPATSPSARVEKDQTFVVFLPPPVDDHPEPQNIPLDIIYEDDDVIIINKPAGMVVHPAPGHREGTLVNALLYHCGDTLSGIGGVRRPGIVHRLDKETTGLIMVAKHDKAHKGLSRQLADRSLSRRYVAYVWGAPPLVRDKIDAMIGRHRSNRQKMAIVRRQGRHAVTHYELEAVYGDVAARVECALETGRTHQIRVHMEFAGFPLIGDPTYRIQPTKAQALLRKGDVDAALQEKIFAFPRQALHARTLGFIHPVTGEQMSFSAPLPDDLAALEAALGKI